jgi:hypothetical protein
MERKYGFLVFGTFMLAGAHAAELSPDYLQGEWCFESMHYPGGKEEENRNWIFEKDGKFLMQQSKHSSTLKHSGTLDLQDRKLQIKPVYMGGYKEVEVVSEDKFIFKWMGDLHVVRGSCK